VRRPDAGTLVSVVRNPSALTALRHDLADVNEPFFDVPVTRQTLDGAANRCLLAVTRAIAARATKLNEFFNDLSEKESESETRTSFARRWPRRRRFMQELISELRRLQRRTPLASVTRPEITAAGLNALAADPAYAAAYRHGWRILRHGLGGPPNAEQLWISPTWEIYERWCFVRLAQLIAAECNGVSLACPAKSGAGFSLTALHTSGRQLELLLQPRFPAWDQSASSEFRSLSGLREPDLVLISRDSGGTQCLILDAKYRTSRKAVLDAMASAHIYNDALRCGDRPVVGALLLVPRSGGAPWLEQPEFRVEHRIGVLELSPGVADKEAVATLIELLRHPDLSLAFIK
jgi:hypothetical protein